MQKKLGKHYIREWRNFRGLSLRRLANRMESAPGEQLTSHANIGRIESFQQPYSQEIIEALADALECTVPDLLTVDPSKQSEVVDLMRMIRSKDMAIVRAILEGLPDKTGTNDE